MSVFSLIVIIIQMFSALIAIFFYKSYGDRFALYLRIVLLCNVIVELIGAYYKHIEKNSYDLYYVYVGFIFWLIGLMYLEIVKDRSWRKIMNLLTSLFVGFWALVFFKKTFFNYVVIVGGINVSLFVFFYLRELLLSNEIMNYKKVLPFWVSVGFLVFYLPSIPFFSMLNYMHTRGLFFILHMLIILMNLFIIYGLLCSKKGKY
ncbi:hypothetical protein [Tenacibaculum ovolyticum]|uniref:hypothetical protein n=1 Tax=Tenacibaculum ovolyticum TaxID=104270 RepID=UPI003BAB3D54